MQPSFNAPNFSEVFSCYQGELDQVRHLLVSELQSTVPLVEKISGHLLGAGGKRLRPLMTLMTARLFGYEGRAHVVLGAAVEYIHTATLLHDDVVDESQERRGNMAAHVIWGNKAAILVGDFLFSRAFQLMVRVQNLEVLDVLAAAAAHITEGELLQLTLSDDVALAEADYCRIVEAKTAALFRASALAGAILGGAKEEERRTLADFGQLVGGLFQLSDDILDYGLGNVSLGKRTGDDFYEGKVTLPVILAYGQGTAEERLFWKGAFEDPTPEAFVEAQGLLQKHQVLAQVEAKIQGLAQKAKSALEGLPNLRTSDLESLLSYCCLRHIAA